MIIYVFGGESCYRRCEIETVCVVFGLFSPAAPESDVFFCVSSFRNEYVPFAMCDLCVACFIIANAYVL